MGLVSIAVLWFGTGPSDPQGLRARAIAFSVLAISPLFHAFNCRSTTASIVRTGLFGSRPLLAAVAVSLVIHLVAVLVPILQPVFKTYPMTLTEWGLMLAGAASIVPVIEIFKAVERGRIGKIKGAEPASIRWSAP